jgi:hypothetical protein
MKKLIITEEERRHILSKHNSLMFLNEADKDVMSIQTAVGVKADGSLGPKTISAILAKIGGKPAADVTTQTTTVAAATTQTTTVAAATTQTTTVAAAATTKPANTSTFSEVPVAGATTLDTACGTNKTNNKFRKCKRAFKNAMGL